MKKNLLLLFSFLLFLPGFSQIMFQRVYGTLHFDGYGAALQTSDAGYAVAGNTEAVVGQDGLFLVKTDVNGDTVWTKMYNRNNIALYFSSFAQTSDGGFVLAGDTSVVKTNSSGVVSWSTNVCFSNFSTRIHSLEQTSDGGYILGMTDDSTVVNQSQECPILVKLTSAGHISWVRKYYDVAAMTSTATVHELSDGNIILLTTQTIICTSSTGNFIWAKTYSIPYGISFSDIRQMANGDLVATGTVNSTMGWYPFLIRLNNTNGNIIWTKGYNRPGDLDVWSYCLAEDYSNNIFLVGEVVQPVNSPQDSFFIIKTNSSGNYLSAQLLLDEGSRHPRLRSVQRDFDGGFVMGGDIGQVTSANDISSIILIKADINGNFGCNETALNFSGITPTVTAQQLSNLPYATGGTTSPFSVTSCSGCIITDECTVGINNLSQTNFTAKIFPNPCTSSFTIEVDDYQNNLTFEMYNSLGQKVLQSEIRNPICEIQRGDLAPGIYFYRIVSENKILATGKVMAE